MMGSRGAKGANEIDCLSRNTRRKICLSRKEIGAAKRRFWKRVRREANATARKDIAGIA
jgi:hypothetical protein